ncbi:MAG: N5-glutamine methyltransferase family protein [Acidiferrobacter sp.]
MAKIANRDIAEGEDTLVTAVRDVLAAGGIDDPLLESERIVSEARALCAIDIKDLVMSMAHARASGVPLSYVLGRQRFMGVEISVSSGVLIPRNETELLGWEAVARLREARGDHGLGARVIDMCCGSGNLACGIAHAIPGVHVWASDLMEDCAALTARNAKQLGLDDRIHVGFGDLFEPLLKMGANACDMAVCNPPYISSHRLTRDRQDLLSHEPRQAFDGGPYGLSIYQRLIRDAAPFLVKGGWLLLEVGVGQAPSLERLLRRCGYYDQVDIVADPLGELRLVAARRI